MDAPRHRLSESLFDKEDKAAIFAHAKRLEGRAQNLVSKGILNQNFDISAEAFYQHARDKFAQRNPPFDPNKHSLRKYFIDRMEHGFRNMRMRKENFLRSSAEIVEFGDVSRIQTGSYGVQDLDGIEALWNPEGKIIRDMTIAEFESFLIETDPAVAEFFKWRRAGLSGSEIASQMNVRISTVRNVFPYRLKKAINNYKTKNGI